jgi:hypothetical protein
MNILIAILALISFVAFKIYQVTKVPRELKTVPTLSFLDYLSTIINKSGADKRWEYSREILEKEGIAKVSNILVIHFYH